MSCNYSGPGKCECGKVGAPLREVNAVTVTARIVEHFLPMLTAMSVEHHGKNFPNVPAPTYTMMGGSKYVRIVQTSHGSRSSFCFVDLINGDVLKAASWKKPAPTARSNIFDDDIGRSGVGPYGAKYLR